VTGLHDREKNVPRDLFRAEKKNFPVFSQKISHAEIFLKKPLQKSPESFPGFPEKSGLSRAGTNNFHRDHYREKTDPDRVSPVSS